jgi:heme exporter protein A
MRPADDARGCLSPDALGPGPSHHAPSGACCPPAIVATGLSRRFGCVVALDGVALSVPGGSVTVLVGPNGAGKTTLIEILATLSRPDAGTATVAGRDVALDAGEVRRLIGYVGHRTFLYPDLTAEENLRFYGCLYGLGGRSSSVIDALRAVGLAHRRHDRVRAFSRGSAQRLAIARAIMHDPRVLLLDEPHTGLDPTAADDLDATLVRIAGRGRTVLLASHDLDRAFRLADHIAVLDRGRLVFAGPLPALPASEVHAWFDAVTTRTWPGPDPDAGRRADAGEVLPVDSGGAPAALRPEVRRRRADQGAAPPATAGGPGVASSASRDRTGAADGALAPDEAPARRPRFWETVRAIVWKDLVAEWRAREIVPPVIVFALLVIVVFEFALPVDDATRVAVAPGALWVAMLFGSTLGLSRLLGAEVDSGGLDGLRMSPIDRGAVFVGKWSAGCVFTGLVASILLPALVALLGLDVDAGRMLALALVLTLGLVGWVASGVLLGTMAVGTRAREVLLPVLLYPLVVPLVIPAVSASAAILSGATMMGLGAALTLLIAYDVAFWVVAFLLYGSVMEA